MSLSLAEPMPAFVAELLFSKMSHDLASPAGAVENGIELLEESTGEMATEALGIIQQSAHAVSSRLKFYRLAYGTPGGLAGMGEPDIRRLLTEFYATARRLTVELALLDADVAPERKKLLLNLVLCLEDALPRGGIIQITATPEHLILNASTGDVARPPKAGIVLAGLPSPEGLSPHSVQQWYGNWYAHQNGMTLSEVVTGDSLTLEARG